VGSFCNGRYKLVVGGRKLAVLAEQFARVVPPRVLA
jgi:hypothetical protein